MSSGPRQHNVYLVKNKGFATAKFPRPAFIVEPTDPTDPPQLAVEGVIFQELVIAYGENGWPSDEAESLARFVEPSVYNVEYCEIFLRDLVLRPFNQLFPPQTESDRQKWASVQWQMPFMEIDAVTQWPHIQAKSIDNQFIIDFKFSVEHVLVSYCGPVTFDMQNVQPTVIRRFTSQYTFPIVDLPWSLELGQWPADEAAQLVNVQNDWDNIFNNPDHPLANQARVLELTENLLLSGFRNLLVMLESAGQERENHDLDLRRWRAQDWDNVNIDGNQLHMQSANGVYNIYWHFEYDADADDLNNNNVEITIIAPCRFTRRSQ